MERKNFGLTEASFEQMVHDLKMNDTLFFKQVFLNQFKETMNYVKREYGADHEDAYDATMDTLLEFRKRFVEGKLKYGNLRFLFTKMSAQMYLRNKQQQSFLKDADIMEDEEQLHGYETLDIPETFKEAWKALGSNCKQLLTQHFYGAMKLTEIAKELSKTPATIRKQKERCIKRIKEIMLEIS